MGSKRISLISWALYDWAVSSYSAIIETFIFPVFVTKVLANSEEVGISSWGYALGISGLIIAIGGPILGAAADQGINKKRAIFIFTFLAVICCFILGWSQNLGLLLALFFFSLAAIGSEFAVIFYNSLLPNLATQIGKWSGIGWGIGYLGGMASLFLALILLSYSSVPSIFILVSIWYAFFSLPLFLFTPSTFKNESLSQAVSFGFKQLLGTFKQIKKYQGFFRFFIARMFFIDGLLTLFAFGGIYAATKFQMDEKAILYLGIVLNITAGVGALGLSILDDKIGSKKMMVYSLLALIVMGSALLMTHNVLHFWILASLLGIFIGPVQASSRAFLAKTAPAEVMTEMFGFFAFSGKATAFLGPFVVSILVSLTGSITWGMSTIIIFLAIGLLILASVPNYETISKNS